MKKIIKKAIITMVAIFALIGFSGTALAASGNIIWGGTEAYNSYTAVIQEIGDGIDKLKADKNSSDNKIKDKENIIKDKENIIAGKEQEIEAKQKEIDELKNTKTNNKDQLNQAEIDMKNADQKAKDVLNKLK